MPRYRTESALSAPLPVGYTPKTPLLCRRAAVNPDDSWVTIHEAATHLGVSQRTLRRRIRAGQVPAQLVPGPRGRQYLVAIPTAASPAGSVDGDVASALQAASAMLAQDMVAVRAEIAALRDEVARLHQQVAILAAHLLER